MMVRLPRVPGDTVLARTCGVDMPAGGRGIDADLPGELSGVLGLGKQPGMHLLPHPVSPEPDEQVVDPPPRSVAFGDVAPGTAGTDAEEDAVDQGS